MNGSVSAKISAFSRDSSGVWEEAFLGAFSSGLGVTDSGEGDGSDGLHRVDNVGRDNFVLYRFSDEIVVDEIRLESVGADSDIEIWIGNIPGAFDLDNLELSNELLESLGFTEVNTTGSSNSRTADVNDGNVSGNILVVAARTDEHRPKDRFKIKKVKLKGVEREVYGNIATVSAPDVPPDSDPSHYKNPDPKDKNPGVDIEKTTNGRVNYNVDVAPDFDNEDSPDGPGVPILEPGSEVTWTYQITNTGNVPIAGEDIEIVDDNGTPDDTSDDFSVSSGDILFDEVISGNPDDILDPGEIWNYKATGIVEDLVSSGESSLLFTTGNSGLDGTDGNVREFMNGSVSAKISAFSRDSSGVWEEAFLGAFSSGLGVTDSGEGDGSDGLHRVDNVGRDNFVLYRFSDEIVVDEIRLESVGADSDIEIWIGNIPGAFDLDNLELSNELLESLGFTEVNTTGSSNSRTADVNDGNVSGNILVVAARTGEHRPKDRFKIEKVKVKTAEKGFYQNIAYASLYGLHLDSDRSHYTNPGDNGINYYNEPPSDPSLHITHTLNVDQDGSYSLVGEVFAPNGGANSLWIQVNGGEWIEWHIQTGSDWQDTEVTDENGNPIVFDLTAGVHEIKIAIRETGTAYRGFTFVPQS